MSDVLLNYLLDGALASEKTRLGVLSGHSRVISLDLADEGVASVKTRRKTSVEKSETSSTRRRST